MNYTCCQQNYYALRPVVSSAFQLSTSTSNAVVSAYQKLGQIRPYVVRLCGGMINHRNHTQAQAAYHQEPYPKPESQS